MDPPRARHLRGAPFCSNPACALHVRMLDEAVEGGGNWLTLPDGRMFGRIRSGNTLLCDACATHRGPVRLTGTEAAGAYALNRRRARQ